MKKYSLYTAPVLFLIIAVIAIFFAAKSGYRAEPADGEWEGTGKGFNGPITVSITVKDGKITACKVISESESHFAKPAMNEIIAKVLEKGNVNNIDAVSGATYVSNGVIEAVKHALALASGKASSSLSKKTYTDASCDIVVAGAGGAGLSAAVQAASKGLSVIVLEKRGLAGGNTNFATGGLNASETSVQKALGIEDSNAQYYEDTMKGGKNLNDAELVKNMAEHSAETVDWLISLGADLSDVGKMAGSTNKRTHRPKGGAAVGDHLISVLQKAAESKGVEIRFESTVTDIIVKDGKVSGLKVSSENGDYTVNAKAVIIATGGFGANGKMVSKYRPEFEGFGTTNHEGATGDAFEWGKELKIALTQMEQIQTHPTVVPLNGIMITEAVRGNGAIMINREGKRFNNEMATRDLMSKAILKQTGKTAYLLFDRGVRESLKAIEGYAKKGLLTEGAGLSELAAKLNIPVEELEKTVKNYNSYQASGKDEEFGRAQGDMVRALSSPPYYAVEVAPAVHHTMGGIKINVKAEVLNTDGKVIPALYAAGEVTGGIHGANRLGGNAVADICIYGKTAADSAIEFIKNF
ncbi:flavocytochrome c [Treponema pedis]|uniref:Urocanate reductase n=2 Tax=Treponema pedis TaxID=409322 RepID=S6A4S0_9SPIR|nr:flavocytochrome c [Treponema pedis]AGT44711.1 flavocytochrome c [Treponema pedis str. T A4]QOW60029.1 flavocytochrome c [Treponema pedis]